MTQNAYVHRLLLCYYHGSKIFISNFLFIRYGSKRQIPTFLPKQAPRMTQTDVLGWAMGPETTCEI